MSCQNCWKKLLAFGLSLMLGFFAVDFFKTTDPAKIKTTKIRYNNNYSEEGRGGSGSNRYIRPFSICISDSPACDKNNDTLAEKSPAVNVAKTSNSKFTAISVISKPKAQYTDLARQNQVQGTVRLRVTFLANRNIGSISTVTGLPDGLTEQSIAAARNMRFEPAKKDGIPYTITRQVEYNFTLY